MSNVAKLPDPPDGFAYPALPFWNIPLVYEKAGGRFAYYCPDCGWVFESVLVYYDDASNWLYRCVKCNVVLTDKNRPFGNCDKAEIAHTIDQETK
jgi:hypothetical protein